MRRLFRPLLICALLGATTRAGAQEPTPAPATDKAPVVLDGRVLFEVGESGTWSPEQRATEIIRILRAAAAAPEPVNLLLAEHEGYPTVRMGDWHLLTVMDSDVLPGMDSGEQAQRWLQTIEAALVQARSERTAAYLSAAWLRVAAVLALAALIHWLLGRLARRLTVLAARRHTRPGQAPIGGGPAWQLPLELMAVALQAATWFAALRYAAEQFPASRQVRYDLATLLGGGLYAPLFSMNARSYSALDLVWLVGAFAALWIVVSLFTRVLSTRLVRATGATRGALQPLATLLKYGLIFIGLIVILQVAGLNLSSLAIFASVLGVGIGFGLQSIANNFVSGIVISFERSIKPGDFVAVGELKGTVLSVGARSTIIRTLDRVSIVVPNARLLENEVVNWSYGDELSRMHLPVGVAYGSDIEAVRGALFEAVRSHPAVLTDPRPEVRFMGFGDNALNLDVLVWSSDPAGQALLQSELYYRIEAHLRRAGISIPFPQRTLHLPADELGRVLAQINAGRAAHAVELYDARGAPAIIDVGDAPIHHPQPSVEPANGPAPAPELDIDGLIARMRSPGGLAIADRRHLLTVYEKCFVGTEAVEWLMRAHDLTREGAVHLGQSLVERGVFHHVLDEHPFRDGNFFYRFYADEPPEPRIVHA